MNQKSSKNQPKIDQEETENPPKNKSKIVQKSILEGSRGVFGWTWRPIPKIVDGNPFFGTLLGPSWRPLKPSWRPFGAVLAVLAASWARLGLVLAAEIGPQVDQISTQKSIRTLMLSGIDLLEFWRILLPKMEPRCLQKPPGNRCQSRKRLFFKKPPFSPGKNNDFGGSGRPS